MTKKLAFLALTFGALPAFSEPAPAPQTMFMFGVDTFANGQSNNLGPVIKQVIGEYWVKGACTSADNFAKCDELQFGLSGYPRQDCSDSLRVFQTPIEDGGDSIESRIGTIQTEVGSTLCSDAQYRHSDSAFRIHRELTFPDGEFAPDPVQDTWWRHPHLVLNFLGDFPQKQDGNLDDRVKKTLQQACINFQGGESKTLPSMPTWVQAFRKATDAPAPYAQLLAAAGGTGVCCYGAGCDRLDEDKQIDVCSHINLPLHTETKIRSDLAAGLYNCGQGNEVHQTGAMVYPDGNKFGSKPEIMCHMIGKNTAGGGGGSTCNEIVNTDILGLFSCIRQLPRGVSAEDAAIYYCPPLYASLVDCKRLRAPEDITFIDERQTLFIMNDLDLCDGGANIEITTCPLEGQYCNVDGQKGRCALGQYQCIDAQDVCVSLYEPMPEICNGLDDDCDGQADNMSTSWDKFPQYTLPISKKGMDCQQNDVCVCPNSHKDSYSGNDFATYLDSWEGVCECGEGLTADSTPATTPAPDTNGEGGLTCAQIGAGPGAFGLFLLAFMGIRSRRRRA